MKIANFEAGVVSFVEKEVAPSIPSTLDRFLLWGALAGVSGKLEQLLVQYQPLLVSLGILDESGINLERLEQVGNAAFTRQPDVKIYKMTFRQDDFTKLLTHLKNFAA